MWRRSGWWLALGLLACSDEAASPEVGSDSGEEELLSAGKINGASTGAMIRQATPAGYRCIESTITVPDYLTRDDPAPWIYYGFDDDKTDVEAGLSFQQGTADQSVPRRYKAYLRQGKQFWYAGEDDRVMPGETVTLLATVKDGQVRLVQNGKTLTLRSSGGDEIQSLAAGLKDSAVHVRRVVGLARKVMTYQGTELPTLGPVRFADTTVCAPGGQRVAFEGKTASWSTTRAGIVYGTSFWPRNRVRLESLGGGVEQITLFPEVNADATGAYAVNCPPGRFLCGGHDNPGDPRLLYKCSASGLSLHPKRSCQKACEAVVDGDDACAP